jgi:hypothetical protein
MSNDSRRLNSIGTDCVDIPTTPTILRIDAAISNCYEVLADRNVTIALSNFIPGKTVEFFFQQDGAGARTLLIDGSSPFTLLFLGATANLVPSAVANQITCFRFTGSRRSSGKVYVERILV